MHRQPGQGARRVCLRARGSGRVHVAPWPGDQAEPRGGRGAHGAHGSRRGAHLPAPGAHTSPSAASLLLLLLLLMLLPLPLLLLALLAVHKPGLCKECLVASAAMHALCATWLSSCCCAALRSAVRAPLRCEALPSCPAAGRAPSWCLDHMAAHGWRTRTWLVQCCACVRYFFFARLVISLPAPWTLPLLLLICCAVSCWPMSPRTAAPALPTGLRHC